VAVVTTILYLAAVTAVSGSFCYFCSVVMAMAVMMAAAPYLAATAMVTAVSGSSGSFYSPASAEMVMAAANQYQSICIGRFITALALHTENRNTYKTFSYSKPKEVIYGRYR